MLGEKKRKVNLMFYSEVNIHMNQQRIIIIAGVLKMKSKHPL